MQIQTSPMENELIVALEAGSVHNVALGQSGSVYVWGSNKEGQLGLGMTSNKLSIVTISGRILSKILSAIN